MKKNNIKKVFMSLLVIILLLSAACFAMACNTINNYEYTADTFRNLEKYCNTNIEYTVNKATTNYADYYFDEKLETEKCDRFVTYAEKLLDKLDLSENIDESTKLSFFISDDIKTPRADHEERTVYFSCADTKTVEFINYVLQAVNTNTLNYGLLYGVSSEYLVDLKWGKQDIKKESEIKSFLANEENRYILDLTYPVFHEKFSTPEQIDYAKSISVRFLQYLIKTHGDTAIQQLYTADLTFDLTFDNLFYGYLNEWLNKMQIAEVEINTEVLRWVPYATIVPYILVTTSCEYYVDNDWVETEIQNLCTYKDFEFNYVEVKNILSDAETSYRRIREFFDYSENKRYPILLRNMSAYGGLAYSDQIFIHSLFALAHEYTHLISFNKPGQFSSWMLEGIANYCAVIFEAYHSNEHRIAYTDREAYIAARGEIGDWGINILDNYMHVETNENYLLRYADAAMYFRVFEEGINLHDDYSRLVSEGTGNLFLSFSDFLVKTYGKEKYVDLYGNSGALYKTYGKSQTELINEYKQYLFSIFN